MNPVETFDELVGRPDSPMFIVTAAAEATRAGKFARCEWSAGPEGLPFLARRIDPGHEA